jgi:hypothetical protein
MTEEITLREYEAAEKLLEAEKARPGFVIHAAITLVVSVALIIVNIVVAPQFPWSPFPLVGMSIGLLAHYLYGVRWLQRSIESHQYAIERRAIETRGTGRPMPASGA